MTPRRDLVALEEKPNIIEQLWDSLTGAERQVSCPTASNVVKDALGLLRDREQTREDVLAEIREQVEVGSRLADAGQWCDGREFFEDLRQRRARQA